MKKTLLFAIGFAFTATMFLSLAEAADGQGSKWFQVNNRLRLEYDDNYNQSTDNEQDSLKLIEELELFFNIYMDQTFVSLRYRPQFVWWDDREGDDTDLHHDVDFVMNHSFTPRLGLNLKDTFRIGESPEIIEDGVIIREKDDFTYNSFNGTIGYLLSTETRFEAAGRHVMLQYDEGLVAEREDYTIVTAGANLRHQLVPETSIQGELRLEEISYDENDRGSESLQAGGALEHAFSPGFLGGVRGGYMQRSFEADIDDETTPYADASVTLLPSPETRVSSGIGYTLRETDVFPYASQNRLSFLASIAHNFTSRLGLFLSATYYVSELDGQQAAGEELEDFPDGEETGIQLSSKLSYRINRSNTVELNWQFVDLDTDVREDYVRNRMSVGWKTEL